MGSADGKDRLTTRLLLALATLLFAMDSPVIKWLVVHGGRGAIFWVNARNELGEFDPVLAREAEQPGKIIASPNRALPDARCRRAWRAEDVSLGKTVVRFRERASQISRVKSRSSRDA